MVSKESGQPDRPLVEKYNDPAELKRALTNLSKVFGLDDPAKNVQELLDIIPAADKIPPSVLGWFSEPERIHAFVQNGVLPLDLIESPADLDAIYLQQQFIEAIRQNLESIINSADRMVRTFEILAIFSNRLLESGNTKP